VKSGTGLRYQVYEEGVGDSVRVGSKVKLAYKISLLNGKICYTSEKSGPKVFVVGKSDVETGLHEAIQYTKVGDKARFILPSHLAFGLAGDSEQIPSKATLIYEVEVLQLID